MPTIMPISSLRSYTEVLESVSPGAPVFLTRNGRGKFAILDMEDYDRLAAENRLFAELDAGRVSGEQGGWVASEGVRARFNKKATHAL